VGGPVQIKAALEDFHDDESRVADASDSAALLEIKKWLPTETTTSPNNHETSNHAVTLLASTSVTSLLPSPHIVSVYEIRNPHDGNANRSYGNDKGNEDNNSNREVNGHGDERRPARIFMAGAHVEGCQAHLHRVQHD